MLRPSLAALALAVLTPASQAGPFRRYYQPAYQPYYQPTYQSYYQPVYESPIAATPAATQTPAAGGETPIVTTPDAAVGDGLDEVNAQRAARGLRPYVRDDGLTQAARACAQFR